MRKQLIFEYVKQITLTKNIAPYHIPINIMAIKRLDKSTMQHVMVVEIPQLENRLLTSHAFITDEHICKSSVIKVTKFTITIQIENNKKIQIKKNIQPGYRFA